MTKEIGPRPTKAQLKMQERRELKANNFRSELRQMGLRPRANPPRPQVQPRRPPGFGNGFLGQVLGQTPRNKTKPKSVDVSNMTGLAANKNKAMLQGQPKPPRSMMAAGGMAVKAVAKKKKK